MPSVDRLLLRRIKTFARILFFNNQGHFLQSAPSFALFTFLVAVADQVATYYTGILPSEFFVALGDRNASTFNRLIWKSILIIFGKAVVLAACKYATSYFYLKCREICGRAIHRLYFQNLAFYKLNVSEKCDNPDQRMTQDVEKLTRIIAQDLFIPVIMAPFIIGYYSYLTFQSAGWLGPTAIYVYFFLSTVINKFLLSPIIRLGIEQEKNEGNFRAKHLEVRSHAEAIAFLNSGETENQMADEKFENLLRVQKKLAGWRAFLCLITSFFDYYGGTLSYLLVAVPIFITHQLDSYTGVQLAGIVSKNAFIYLYLIYNFARVVLLTETFGEMSAVAHRVIGLYEELRKCNNEDQENERQENCKDNYAALAKSSRSGMCVVDMQEKNALGVDQSPIKAADGHKENDLLLQNGNHPERPSAWCIESVDPNGAAISLKSVSIKRWNDSSLLIQDLTLHIVHGCSILINGESSTGKTSLLRILAGLWEPESGSIKRHIDRTPNSTIFLSQDVYFPNGNTSLMQQLTYPSKMADQTQGEQVEQCKKLLKEVLMGHLLKRFANLEEAFDGDWMSALSKGELQRLSIARILYHNPKIAFLDECTSAIGEEMESKLYRAMTQKKITLISVGHRESLKNFHDYELHLNGKGGWTLSKLNKLSAVSTEKELSQNNSQ